MASGLETAQWSRACVVPIKDLSSVPSTLMVAHNGPELQFQVL